MLGVAGAEAELAERDTLTVRPGEDVDAAIEAEAVDQTPGFLARCGEGFGFRGLRALPFLSSFSGSISDTTTVSPSIHFSRSERLKRQSLPSRKAGITRWRARWPIVKGWQSR
jgi:hypothetical protein